MMFRAATFAAASVLALALGSSVTTGTAQAGFLDQLFGSAPPATPQLQVPDFEPPQFDPEAPVRRRAKRKVVVDDKPKLQKPTDLMHDATLQSGDAVMMKGGVRIYTGEDRDGTHTKADFEALDALDGVPKTEKRALMALDTTRNDPLRGSLQPDTIASGRSASVSAPIVAGRPVVDARGKTVRYVGP